MKLDDVTLHYGQKPVLDHLTLELPTDRITCLYGPSGCGKTTLLRLLAGLVRPQSGALLRPPQRPALLFQEDRLLPQLTAGENIATVLPPPRAGEALDWLSQVRLAGAAHELPGALSGGMRRRVALARALAYGGDLLLLDEPFTGLDPELAAEMAALVRRTGLPAVVATHSLEEIAHLGGVLLPVDGPPLTVRR